MIVFYDKKSGNCMLSIDCEIGDITIDKNRAYYNGEAVNNDMSISAMAEVPRQYVYDKKFSELKTGDEKSSASRLLLIEAELVKSKNEIIGLSERLSRLEKPITNEGIKEQ